METQNQKKENQSLVIHYYKLRQLIGVMGIALPVLLIIGSHLNHCGHIETSISNFFYTNLRDVFVVTLSAVSLFLFTYKGYDKRDKIAINIAGVLGLIVAFFPTTFQNDICLPCYQLLPSDSSIIQSYKVIPCPHSAYIGDIHLGCASLFFFTLAYISIFLFTKTRKTEKPTHRKLIRNRFYRVCGCIMVGCILLLVPYFLSDSISSHLAEFKPVFWMETIALWAFGISWLIKGQVVLKDKPEI
jgi:hypothetical protein